MQTRLQQMQILRKTHIKERQVEKRKSRVGEADEVGGNEDE